MARVGALITPFIAQVGVAPNTEGVGLTKAKGGKPLPDAGPLRGPGCVCTAWSPVSNPPCGSSHVVCKRESGGSEEPWDLSNVTQLGGRGAGSQTRVFLMIWPKTVWIRINRPPRLRGKLMSQPPVSDSDDSVSLQTFSGLCTLKHFCLFGGDLILLESVCFFLISNSFFFPVFNRFFKN